MQALHFCKRVAGLRPKGRNIASAPGLHSWDSCAVLCMPNRPGAPRTQPSSAALPAAVEGASVSRYRASLGCCGRARASKRADGGRELHQRQQVCLSSGIATGRRSAAFAFARLERPLHQSLADRLTFLLPLPPVAFLLPKPLLAATATDSRCRHACRCAAAACAAGRNATLRASTLMAAVAGGRARRGDWLAALCWRRVAWGG